MRYLIGRQAPRLTVASLLCLGLLLLLAVAPNVGTAAPRTSGYSVVDIGNFNTPLCPGGCPLGSAAYGLNSSGDAVGWSYYTWDASVGPFKYTFATGELTSLGRGPDQLDGWSRYAYAINDGGVVAGTAGVQAAYNGNHPVVWRNGVMRDLFAGLPDCAAPAYYNCLGNAFDINSRDQIVGARFITNYNVPQPVVTSNGAFLYSDGAFTDLGSLPGDTGSTANAINDRGDIVGTSGPSSVGMPCCGGELVTREGGGTAFLYRAGAMSGLGTLGGPLSGANDISNNRKIVGFSDTPNGERHAFVYTAHDGMRDLGTLGGTFSEATAVNPRGTVIVGNSTTATGEVHGFVYANRKMTDLTDLIPPGSGEVTEAHDVNDTGVIAARMTLPNRPVWAAFGVLLSPAGHH